MELMFTSLGPVERGTSLSAIENFKRCFACTFLEAHVVGELSKWKAVFPFHAEGDDTGSEHIFKDLIHTLDLATSLRVKGSAEPDLRAHGGLKGVPEP